MSRILSEVPLRYLSLAILVATYLLTTGCVVGPDYHPPGDIAVPQQWRHLEGGQVDGITEQGFHDTHPTAWWLAFDDPVLNGLIEQATEQNLGLEEAAQRIWEARALRGVVRSDLLPQIDAYSTYNFRKTPTSGGIAGQLGSGPFRFDPTMDQWTMGFNGSWEIDVFGRLKRNVEAADGDIAASLWNYRDTLVILLADVATNYVDARAFQARLQVARDNLRTQTHSLELTQKRFRAGAVNGLDVAQAKANALSTEAEIPTLEVGYQQAVNRLSVLLGQLPGFVDDLLRDRAPIPRTPAEIAVGIPADLLRRRPDVQQAESELAAQTARIGAAIGQLYPQFTLGGSFGVDAARMTQLFTTPGMAANVGPAVRWDILNFGRLRFNVEVEEARHAQTLARYRQSVLAAAEEVDNALIGYTREQRRRELLRLAAAEYRRSVELSQIQYEQGAVDFQRVLDSQRLQLQTDDLLLRSEAQVTTNLIQIYLATGGGWELPTVVVCHDDAQVFDNPRPLPAPHEVHVDPEPAPLPPLGTPPTLPAPNAP